MVSHEFFMTMLKDRTPARVMVSELDGEKVEYFIVEDTWVALTQDQKEQWLRDTQIINERKLHERYET